MKAPRRELANSTKMGTLWKLVHVMVVDADHQLFCKEKSLQFETRQPKVRGVHRVHNLLEKLVNYI